MYFNSIPFLLFFITVFAGYWFLFSRNLNIRNGFLLLSSYLFYGYADWRFLLLLIAVSFLNYGAGLAMGKTEHIHSFRKTIFIFILIFNILILSLFKYFNFFQEGFSALLSALGFRAGHITLNLILPIGISFYIFLAISYVVDVYLKRMPVVRNPVELLLSLSFFPIILAGPIQRPIALIPQIRQKRVFSNALASDGIKQIIWGLFMKMVIADQSAVYVNQIFGNPEFYNGVTLLSGAVLFTLQIYADFAGYSHLAIGISKLLGFNIMQNFAYPLFARDIRDFWKRWNISLTTWFRDYLFLPVAFAFSRKIKRDKVAGISSEIIIYAAGIAITWTLTGLWHGANFTFIVWGAIHGAFLLFYHIVAKPRKRFIRQFHLGNNRLFIFTEYLLTMILVVAAFVFFRSVNLTKAVNYFSSLLNGDFYGPLPFSMINDGLPLAIAILLFFLIEWAGRSSDHPLAKVGIRWHTFFRWSLYYAIIIATVLLSAEEHSFIYFQF
jgi:D-alanyl-lipoteichoic acid acyltransferase DltB (MBOAT superfamily)